MDDNKITTAEGKTVVIKDVLNCKEYGIYAGQCTICQHIYVGQTITPFHVGWNTHRAVGKKMLKSRSLDNNIDKSSDEQALFHHYSSKHPDELNLRLFSEAYRVFFIEKSFPEKLDLSESFWITKLNAKINIMNTFLPKIKTFN